MYLRSILVLTLALAPPLAGKQAAQLLRYRFVPGQADRYSVDVRVKVHSDEPILELNRRTVIGRGTNTLNVLKVNPDGSAQIQVAVEPLRLAGAPRDTTLTNQLVTFTMTSRGEGSNAPLVRRKAISPRDLFVDPSALSRIGAVLPEKPVKPGDRWTSTAPNPFQSQGKITVYNRYFAPDRIGATPTARIQQMMSIPIDTRILQPQGVGTVKVKGLLKVFSAVHFAPILGKILKTSSLGTGRITLTPESAKSSEESAIIMLNVDAISELISPSRTERAGGPRQWEAATGNEAA